MPSLRELRRARGLSLEQVADAADTSAVTVSLVERGLRDVPPGSAARWAMELHVGLHPLFQLAAAARAERRRKIAEQELTRVFTESKGEPE